MKTITVEEYFYDCQVLVDKLRSIQKYHVFDCIVAIKRSGWILGVLLSNQLQIPVFTESEFRSMPHKFKSILIVDDKISSGKTISKVVNKCKNQELKFRTACLYVQEDIRTDFFIKKTKGRVKPFYERYEKHNNNDSQNHKVGRLSERT